MKATTPMHLVRKPGQAVGKRKRRRSVPAREYVPGFFTALIRQHDWPPAFEAKAEKLNAQALRTQHLQGQHLLALRQEQAETGKGWGRGTLSMPGSSKTLGPTLAALLVPVGRLITK